MAAAESKQVRIGSTTALLLIAQVVTLGVSFATSVLLARALGPAGKGQLTLLLQIPGTIAMFAGLGIPAANAYFVGRRVHGVGVTLGNSLLAAAAATLVGLPIYLVLTRGPGAPPGGFPLVPVMLVAAVLPLSLLVSFVSGIGTALQQLPRQAAASLLGALASTVLVALAFITHRLDLGIAAAASPLMLTITFLVLVTGVERARTDPVRVSVTALREASGYSLKSYFAGLTSFLNYRQDVFVVGYLAGNAQLGLYSIAVTFAELLWYLPNALSTTILSKSMAAQHEAGAQFTARSSRITVALMIVLAGVSALVIRPVLTLLYTGKFVDSAAAFYWLLPGVIMLGIVKILSSYLAAHGKLYPLLGLLSAGVNLVANLLLVPRLGIVGAAVSSSISYTLMGVILIGLYRRETGARLRALLVLDREDLRAIRQSLASYLPGERGPDEALPR
ncbi:MAG TPA: oligosaccharide flippase family protein [Coriobacteriia bacterium]|jgi:O-antigen/teichoic acid export membrane protein